MSSESKEFTRLRLTLEGAVARVTIDHPPVNLMDGQMMRELGRAARLLAEEESIKVVVVDSANDDFFIAHADVGPMLDFPPVAPERSTTLSPLHGIFESWRTLPQATIAVIDGAARGGGTEFAAALDIRLAGDEARLALFEISLGIIPGAGGTQYVTRLVGRGRALEMILSGRDITAVEAAQWGLVNRVVPSERLLDEALRLAREIAHHPRAGISGAKQAVAAAEPDLTPGLLAEETAWFEVFATGHAQRRMRRFLEAGGQKLPLEREWDAIASLLDTDGTTS